MALIFKNKLLLDIPIEVIESINQFYIESYKNQMEEPSLTKFFNTYFPFYLLEYDNIPVEKLCYFQNLMRNDKNKNSIRNFTFRISDEYQSNLRELAHVNLRTVKGQATHFVYFVYLYINHSKI